MGRFSDLDLSAWQEEDLEDLADEYPGLENMSIEELDKLASKLYWEAQNLYYSVTSLEGKADTIRAYIRALGG